MTTLVRAFFHILIFWVTLFRVGVCSAETVAHPSNSTQSPVSERREAVGVRSITLPHFEPDLPVAAGREEFMMVCVSCHSPRYVSMQPPFAQPQWEATVDKMAKVYGAQIDAGQKQAIIGYLEAVKGPGTKAQWLATTDEDADSISVIKIPPYSETAPLLVLATNTLELAAEVNRGVDLFKQNCVSCHGITGRGDGFISPVLLRKPENLAAIRYSIRLLSRVLWNGKRGTSMPSWRGLPQADLSALAAYIQTLHRPTQSYPPSPDAIALGSKLFLQNCAPCHGMSADGKGVTAVNLTPEPANFALKQPDTDYILQLLQTGIPGSAMPSWKEQLSDSDRRALADFVRSRFEAAGPNER